MLLTGIGSPHFVLALPFIVLCRRWVSGWLYYSIVLAWTVTTLIPMYGILAIDLATADYLNLPLFGSNPPAITRLVASLYAWDRFITVGAVANLLALLSLLITTVRRSGPHEAAREQVTATDASGLGLA